MLWQFICRVVHRQKIIFILQATETTEGIKTYVCSVCGQTKTESIPKKAVNVTPTVAPNEVLKIGDVLADDKTGDQVKIVDPVKKEVSYTAPKNKKKTTINIPGSVVIKGVTYKVTKINDRAFKGNKLVKKVIIPKTIKSIGKEAFSGCKKLKMIIVKTTKLTAKRVGKNAFKGTPKKATMKVPKKSLKAYKKFMKKKGFNGKMK